MSSIVGTYNIDGRPVSAENIQHMLDSMPHRSPDGANIWSEGCVGLGHGMLHETPESVTEHLPLESPSRSLILTSDSRIDNRDDLRRLLSGFNLSLRNDSELILAAYDRWGTDCAEHLIGAFAFAIWDESEKRMFCARDYAGLKPFYYHHKPGKLFSLSSEIKALLRHPDVPRKMNELALAEYIVGMREVTSTTIFGDIMRLPPGNAMTVSPAGIRIWQFYDYRPASGIGSNWSDEKYAEQFQSLFSEAVACRVRSAGKVGCQLSGGLDSGFVACVARDTLQSQGRGPLETFSILFGDSPEADERDRIRAIAEQQGISAHYLDGDSLGGLDNLETLYKYLDDGVVGGTQHLIWHMLKDSSASGVRVLLDGLDGDTTVSHGTILFSEWAASGEWKRFYRESLRVSDRYRTATHSHPFEDILASDGRILRQYGIRQLGQYAMDQRWIHFLNEARRMKEYFSVRWRDLFRVLRPHFLHPWTLPAGLGSGDQVFDELLKPAFADRIQMQNRVTEYRTHHPEYFTVRESQLAAFQRGRLFNGLEKMQHMAAAFGVEARHPFMDRRLIEYCLALPPEQSLKNGWTRYIMRNAMSSIVPDAVTWSIGKALMSDVAKTAQFGAAAPIVRRRLKKSSFLAEYVQMERVEEMLNDIDNLDERSIVRLGVLVAVDILLEKVNNTQ